MTFTEAALEVLRREGKPLHFKKIVELATRENLLDHVGKIPEETMADQLAAHARLPKTERRLLPVQHGTFALTEWGLDEDPQGIEGLIELPIEDLPIRGRERHPVPLRDLSRRDAGPRQEQAQGPGRRRRDEDERRGRRFPPPAEVAFEILAGAGRPLALAEIAAQGAERLLMSDAFVRDAGSLRAALQEDNRRREGAGRQALFAIDGETITLAAQPEPGERVALPAVTRGPLSAGDMRRAALAALRRRLRECDPATIEHVAGKLLEKEGYRELKVAKRGREHVIYTARRRMGVADVRHAIRIVRTGVEAGRRDVTDLRRDLGHYGAQIGVVITAGEAGREARGEASAAGQLPVLLVCGDAFAEALADAGVGAVPVVVPEVDDDFFRTAAEAAEREEAARLARREEREKRREGRDEPEEREEREKRREGRNEPEEREPLDLQRRPRDGEGREARERDGRPREGRDRERRERREARDREPREAREPREPRPVIAAAAGEGLEPEPVEPASGDAASSSTSAPEVAAPVAGLASEASAAPIALLPARTETEPDDDDDGDDDGPEEGEGAEGVSVEAKGDAKDDSAQGERRRRRRRRRRRGGRGRGREGQVSPQGASGAEGQPAAAAAAQPTAAPAPSGGEEPSPR